MQYPEHMNQLYYINKNNRKNNTFIDAKSSQ